MPPTRNYTAGIVLADMCEAVGTERFSGCFFPPPSLDLNSLRPPEEWKGFSYSLKPRYQEAASRPVAGLVGGLWARGVEITRRVKCFNSLRHEILKSIDKHSPDLLWFVLEGQILTKLARSFLDENIPMIANVWDPPVWWIRDKSLDRYTTQDFESDFHEVCSRVRCLGTASHSMAVTYGEKYHVKTVPVLPTMPLSWGQNNQAPQGGDFIIRIAGQLYAHDSWKAFLAMLRSKNWKIGSRPIRIQVAGRWKPEFVNASDPVEWVGLMGLRESIQFQSEAHLIYIPYWFDADFEQVVRLSFPVKLTSALASGTPVFFHGPGDSSPAQFLKQHHVGWVCEHSLVAALGVSFENCVQELSRSPNTSRGSEIFQAYLTHENAMKPAMKTFLGMT
jgi:hypothetical protein